MPDSDIPTTAQTPLEQLATLRPDQRTIVGDAGDAGTLRQALAAALLGDADLALEIAAAGSGGFPAWWRRTEWPDFREAAPPGAAG